MRFAVLAVAFCAVLPQAVAAPPTPPTPVPVPVPPAVPPVVVPVAPVPLTSCAPAVMACAPAATRTTIRERIVHRERVLFTGRLRGRLFGGCQ